MNILIIEDNALKRGKLRDYVVSAFGAEVEEAASYNSGLSACLARRFDLIILDMSMPSFDRTDASHGGRFRVLAGRDIVMRLHRVSKMSPVVIVTGYKDFSVDSQSLTIEDIDRSLDCLGGMYKGFIHFDVADSVWKDRIYSVIEDILR